MRKVHFKKGTSLIHSINKYFIKSVIDKFLLNNFETIKVHKCQSE